MISALQPNKPKTSQQPTRPTQLPNNQMQIYDSFNENVTIFNSNDSSCRSNTKKRFIKTARAIGPRARVAGGGFKPQVQNSQRNLHLISSNGSGSNEIGTGIIGKSSQV